MATSTRGAGTADMSVMRSVMRALSEATTPEQKVHIAAYVAEHTGDAEMTREILHGAQGSASYTAFMIDQEGRSRYDFGSSSSEWERKDPVRSFTHGALFDGAAAGQFTELRDRLNHYNRLASNLAQLEHELSTAKTPDEVREIGKKLELSIRRP